MKAEDQRDDAAPAATEEGAVVDTSRRRFARAGLSGSVVLGSLVSKPVLGAVPYHCTVSGQVSGNLSRASVAGECMLGEPPSYWVGAVWPPPFVKGTQPSQNCVFTGASTPGGPQRQRGTNFNGFTPGEGIPALTNAFFNMATGNGQNQACVIQLTPATSNPATMYQLLTSPNTGAEFDFGRVIVASLLNAANLGTNYPVTIHTIIAMFNATFGGGSYSVTTTKSWGRDRVIEYLESLFKSSAMP